MHLILFHLSIFIFYKSFIYLTVYFLPEWYDLNVKKQLRINHLILSPFVELPSWHNRNLFRVRIKRQKFQITALLYLNIHKTYSYISNTMYFNISYILYEFYSRTTQIPLSFNISLTIFNS